MLLHAVGRKYVKPKNYKNLLTILILIIWFVVGYFTLKRQTYTVINRNALKKQLAANASSYTFSDKTEAEIKDFMWNLEFNYLETDKFIYGEPERDFMLILNIFIGVADDIEDSETWYVAAYSFIGYITFGWNVIRFLLWFDKKVDLWLDNRKTYDEVDDDEPNRDIVLEYRKQMREKEATGKPIEIKSYHSSKYDVRYIYHYLGPVFLKPVKSVSPAFLYPSIYAITLFVLAGIHTWMVEPNLFVDNMMRVTAFTTGIDSSMFVVNKNGTNYLLYAIGFVAHIFLCGTMWRLSQLIVVLYQFVINDKEANSACYLEPVVEGEVQSNYDHHKTE